LAGNGLRCGIYDKPVLRARNFLSSFRTKERFLKKVFALCKRLHNTPRTMSNTTKKQRQAAFEAERAAERAAKAELIIKLASSYDPRGSKVLNTLSYGLIEVWNYCECIRQNAEADGNDLVSHFECALADELPEVGAHFRSLGFSF
jgi:hypothetical protein